MVFSSPIFLFYFLPLVLLLYFLSRGNINFQNVILFFSSLLFYFWGEKAYTIIILISIVCNYVTANGIEKYPRYRHAIVTLGVILNLSLLVYFKYINFFLLEFMPVFGVAFPEHESVHLPLGISFFTFHGLTYIIDVYRKEANPCKSLLNTGLYILFFPQLIAGPIVKYADIEKQLTQRHLSNEKLYAGIKRFIIGLAKKIIIANSLGRIADQIFSLQLNDMSTGLIWFGAVVFAYQIYYDFSGYSDMALGMARIMGFDFKENFNFPFTARSFNELWQRWHMSLTGFFKSYLYIPLGGNRHGAFRTYLNLMIVFTLIGFWHGAAWNCVLWGVFIGFFIVLEKILLGKYLEKLPFVFSNLYTMILFSTAIIIFKIEDIHILPEVFSKALGIDKTSTGLYSITYYFSFEVVVILGLAVLFSYPLHLIKGFGFLQEWKGKSRWVGDIVYLGLFLLTISMMAASTYNPFIYFKF